MDGRRERGKGEGGRLSYGIISMCPVECVIKQL